MFPSISHLKVVNDGLGGRFRLGLGKGGHVGPERRGHGCGSRSQAGGGRSQGRWQPVSAAAGAGGPGGGGGGGGRGATSLLGQACQAATGM